MHLIERLRKLGILNQWVWVFALTTALQVFRGSMLDTTIFSLCTLTVWASAAGLFGRVTGEKVKVKRPVIMFSVLIFALALSVFPRHSYIHGALVLGMLPLVLRLTWYKDSGKKDKPDQRMSRAIVLWTTLCLGITFWEFMANILGQLANSLHIYPTISVLIDPLLDTTWGQAIFVVLWLAMGIGFLRIWGSTK
jgi:hypothetical protein